MIKRIIYTVLLVLWMIIIFMFSNQNANNSQSTSDKVISTIIEIVETVTNNEISEDKRINVIEDTSFIVRKLAHFTIYFILGVLVYLTLTSYHVNKTILFSILFSKNFNNSIKSHKKGCNTISRKTSNNIVP